MYHGLTRCPIFTFEQRRSDEYMKLLITNKIKAHNEKKQTMLALTDAPGDREVAGQTPEDAPPAESGAGDTGGNDAAGEISGPELPEGLGWESENSHSDSDNSLTDEGIFSAVDRKPAGIDLSSKGVRPITDEVAAHYTTGTASRADAAGTQVKQERSTSGSGHCWS